MTIDFIILVVLALATWRVSSLLVNEDGPWDMLVNFRDWTLDHTTLFTCLWCSSVWVALALFGVMYIFPWVFFFYIPLALSALAIIIDRYSQ